MARRRGPARKTSISPPGRLRIVAGKWRSRLLKVTDLPGLRPTPERVRETLFNWLGPTIEGKRCLDLFAGTGALGFEALSRGAASVEFVERSREAMSALEESRDTLQADGARLVCADAMAYLRQPPGAAFQVVFLDPPYGSDSVSELCRLLTEGDWLAPDARVYFEQHSTQAPPKLPTSWSIMQEKEAGQVRYALAISGPRS